MPKSPVLWFPVTLLAIAIFTLLAPAERTLGTSVRLVYLHGAWVWAALATFIVAGGVGLVALVTSRVDLHFWSRALGRTGLLFWITYLPISLWTMQANWNGLFLAEPRWRVGVVFALGGLILQIGLALVEEPTWASISNSLFVLVLTLALQTTEQVMHPPSPILASNSWRIQFFFAGLLVLTLLAAWHLTRWWRQIEI